jgi:hypothetical protein
VTLSIAGLVSMTFVLPFGATESTAFVPVVAGDFAGNGLKGFVTLNDISGNEDVLSATSKP